MATSGEKEKVDNPLDIAEVLEQVLNYVPSGDLMNAREVAKLWRDESLDNFRNSIVYVLDPDTEAQRFLRMSLNIEANGGGSETMSGDNASSFPSSQSGMYKFQEKPIKKFRLTGPQEITADGFNNLGLGPMGYFWNQCGPNLTYLDLKGPTYVFESSFVDALILFFKLCPNLEQLEFSPVWGVDEHEHGWLLNEDDDQEQMDDVFLSNEAGCSLFSVRRVSKTQLANMQECLALKMKSLSIEFTGMDRYMAPRDDHHHKYSRLWRFLFNIMPKLKKLSLDGKQYFHVMDALVQKTQTTNQLIQLESFEYNGEKTDERSYVHFGLVPLWNYLKDWGEYDTNSGPFKDLKLKKISFYSLWHFPRTFWNILFDIRTRIESLCIELWFRRYDSDLPHHGKFDFFNLIFPNLVELTLEFDYKPFECNEQEIENFLFFDFSVLRGTPNLTRLKVKTLDVPDTAWLKRRLTVEDLRANVRGQKWHLMNGIGIGLDGWSWEDCWGIDPIDGDGTETFVPEIGHENEIFLEKMKEFYFTGRFTKEALLVLGKWMKNLKEFAAIFDDETISIPFVVWPGTLKLLTVLQPSFKGEEQISGKLISDLREMYPEVKIVLEGQIDIPMDRLALGDEK